MSRHVTQTSEFDIAYGYDHMGMWPGYFFQVWDPKQKSDEEPEGKLIENHGMVKGIARNQMLELMTKYNINNKKHIQAVQSDLPF